MKKLFMAVLIIVLVVMGIWFLARKASAPGVQIEKELSSSSLSSSSGSAANSASASKAFSKSAASLPAVSSSVKEKVFNLTGQMFSFSQKEIKVKKGDKVKINFTSLDILHNWRVDEFNAKTERVSGGKSASVEFVANKAGEFEFFCDVGNHRSQGMVGKFIVE